MASILVTGGTGLIGKHLCKSLKDKGYKVSVLSRNQNTKPNTFYWNLETDYIDTKAITEANYIIHLAGAGIADERWTKERKRILINSRVKSTNLLLKKVRELNPELKGFIAASGVGYYGAISTEKTFSETDSAGTDFLSEVCKLWENESLKFQKENIRTVIFRTGVVLSKKGGALEKISKPIKLGFGAALGTGKQYTPWIHIDDLCNMYIDAIENSALTGIYNAVAPEHITNSELTKSVAKAITKPLWLPNIPSALLKLVFGEMSIILLKGSRVSSKKIIESGFNFKYPSLKVSLKNYK